VKAFSRKYHRFKSGIKRPSTDFPVYERVQRNTARPECSNQIQPKNHRPTSGYNYQTENYRYPVDDYRRKEDPSTSHGQAASYQIGEGYQPTGNNQHLPATYESQEYYSDFYQGSKAAQSIEPVESQLPSHEVGTQYQDTHNSWRLIPI